ncbi:dipeptide epimerase [bacterium]|nr:dipeptide epimerase [bacterium]
MKLHVEALELETTHPFVIARGGAQRFENLVLRIEADGLVGEGEGSATHYYGETPAIARLALEKLLDGLADTLSEAVGAGLDLARIAAVMDRADRVLARNPAAKAALDGALWDLAGRQQGAPVWRLLGFGEPVSIESSFTIALAEPERMLERARAAVAAGFGILKLKCGTERDLEVVEAVAAATGVRLRVDANGSWRADTALGRLERLALAGVEFVEQPLELDDIAGYRAIAGRAPLPVVLDESVHDALGLALFGELADGVNLKISKLGGITRCLQLARAARELQLDLMMGCMIESSLGIAQGLQLAPLLRWADLDGALLLADDPYSGLTESAGVFTLGSAPGLGVARKDPRS